MVKTTFLFVIALCSISFQMKAQEVCNSVTSTEPVLTLDNDIEVTATINIAEELFFTSMTMDIEITHTFIGDVKFDLTSPQGTRIMVNLGACGDGRNMDATFTDLGDRVQCQPTPPDMPTAIAFVGDVEPFRAFSTFTDESIAGDWTLTVTDTGPGDTGTINSWTLNYCGVATLSVEEQQLLDSVSLAPNPARNVVQLSFPENLKNEVTVSVINILGKTVMTTKTQGNISIPVGHLSSGIYLITLATNQYQTSKRLVVE